MTDANDPHALLRNLTHELFQTETSASKHCRREAERYAGSAPSRALIAVAEHADVALEELQALARREDLPDSAAGSVLGEAFSAVREFVADHTIEAERSYRGTLLGVHHGTDVVRMFGHAARVSERVELAEWADRWLARRLPLVEEVVRQMVWFAQNIERARSLAH